MSVRFTVRAAAFALALLLVSSAAFAQRIDGTLRGTVEDPAGAVVQGAKVTVTNDATGVTNTTETTSAGTYVFPNLLVGTYTVTVERQGFQTYARRNVEVLSNRVVEVNPKLAVGTAETSVEVVSGSELVQTSDATLNNTFDADQIVNLPVPLVQGANSIFNMAVLAPGTTTQGGGVLGTGGSIGGARPRMNNFTVDGLDDNRVDITGPISNVVPDAVAEFNLITNQFSAEYGHSAGGQFNIVTKSGTNRWDGTAFWINSNRKYNAFDNIEKVAQSCDTDPNCQKPRFDFNTVGGSVGGPIIKDHVFIFGAYQRVFAGFAGSSSVIEAPTTDGLANLNTLAENSAVQTILAQFPTAGAATRTINVTNTSTGQTLPVGIGEVGLLAPSFFDETDYHLNGDINFGRQQVRVRYLNNSQVSPNLGDPPLPQFSDQFTFDVQKVTASHVWTLSDRFINDFRVGYTRQLNQFGVPDQFSNFPNVLVGGLTSFQVGPEANSPQGGGQNVYELKDMMSFSKGAHTLKWGAEGRRWIAPGSFLPRSRGDWQYANLQELVNDLVPSTFAKRGAGSGNTDGNQTAFFGFFQDDWKVTPRLTLNLGMRYEWLGVPNMVATQRLNQVATLPGSPFIFDTPTSDTNNWAPRFGFAWDPTGNSNWAIRGGFGVSYDLIAQNFPTLQLPPQLQSEQDAAITCASAAAPAWCATGRGFLAGGGLLQENVPPTTQVEARNATGGVMFDFVMPKVYTWTLGVQRALWNNASLEVRYLGTRGTNMLVQKQLNSRTAFRNGAAPLPVFFSQTDVPAAFDPGTPNLFQFEVAAARRPFQDLGPCSFVNNDPSDPSLDVNWVGSGCNTGFLGAVTGFTYDADNVYHGGSIDFTQRMTRGLYLRANYTYAHNIDSGTNELFSSFINPRRPEDGDDNENERGRSVLDIRHKAAISWIYELPQWGGDNGFARAILNGWQVNGTWLFQTGQPATAISFIDANGNGDAAGDRAVFNPNGDPARTTTVTTVCWDGTVRSFGCDQVTGFSDLTQIVGYVADDPSAGYVQPGRGVRTNVGRNSLETPGRNNVDMSLFKNTKLTEGLSMQVRVEAFNVFNHRQFSFANPGVFAISGIDDSAINAFGYATVGDAGFLDETQLNGGSRNLQLGVKFIF